MSRLRWVDIGAVADFAGRPPTPIRLRDRYVAVFHVDGHWRCIDNACPHAGAPLCDGTVQDGEVICFLHCWRFDLTTGACDVGAAWNVRAYPVREHDGRLLLGLDDDGAAAGSG